MNGKRRRFLPASSETSTSRNGAAPATAARSCGRIRKISTILSANDSRRVGTAHRPRFQEVGRAHPTKISFLLHALPKFSGGLVVDPLQRLDLPHDLGVALRLEI